MRWSLLLEAKDDATLCEIVRSHLDFHPITRHQADVILAHPSRNVRDDTMAILQFHPKLGIRQCFHHLTNHLDDFLLTRHKLQLSIIQHAAQFGKRYFRKFMCYTYYLTTFLRIDFLSFFISFLQVCKLLFINYNIVNFNLFLKILFNFKKFQS